MLATDPPTGDNVNMETIKKYEKLPLKKQRNKGTQKGDNRTVKAYGK